MSVWQRRCSFSEETPLSKAVYEVLSVKKKGCFISNCGACWGSYSHMVPIEREALFLCSGAWKEVVLEKFMMLYFSVESKHWLYWSFMQRSSPLALHAALSEPAVTVPYTPVCSRSPTCPLILIVNDSVICKYSSLERVLHFLCVSPSSWQTKRSQTSGNCKFLSLLRQCCLQGFYWNKSRLFSILNQMLERNLSVHRKQQEYFSEHPKKHWLQTSY